MNGDPCDRCAKAGKCTKVCNYKKDWQKNRGGIDRSGNQRMEVIRMALCKKCKQPIVWVQTRKGRMTPVDPTYIPYKENRQGKDSLVSDRGEVIRCDLYPDNKVPLGQFPTGTARKSHWATCPFAEEFRRERKEAEGA